jgi:glyoxylase-like metal-dependent hydrolase (beta-lactamase superfamily II)
MAQLSFTIGDVRITRLEETYGPGFPVGVLLPAYDAGTVDDVGPDLFAPFTEDGAALLSVHSWLVQTPQKTILVDTCSGNHKNRPTMENMHQLDLPWLDGLAEAGITPDDVDAVVCTHLHLDHVGWNTSLVDGQWVPTFPNATHYFNKVEYEFWEANRETEALAFNAYVFDDSVAPVFDRDRAVLWEGDGVTIDDTLRLELAAGHTPGHCVGFLESKGERGVFSGDSMHSAMQVLVPEWNSGFCLDADGAIAARRQVLDTTAEQGAILMPAHFSAPHAFRLERLGEGHKPVGIH